MAHKQMAKETKTALELDLEVKLNEWVRWIKTGNCPNLGYPRCSMMALILQGEVISKRKSNKPTTQENKDAELIEKLINKMLEYKPVMAESLRSYYLQHYSLRKNAARLGISHTQYKIYVRMAKEWMIGKLFQ